MLNTQLRPSAYAVWIGEDGPQEVYVIALTHTVKRDEANTVARCRTAAGEKDIPGHELRPGRLRENEA